MSEKYGAYFKGVEHLKVVDVYRVLNLFSVDDHALGHAAKKLLLSGARTGGKTLEQDITEARDTLNRWLEMQAEDRSAMQTESAAEGADTLNDWDAAESRMDTIGTNGNDGSHYDTLVLPEDVIIPGSAHFIVVYENGQMVAHDLKPVPVQGCWQAAAGNQYIGLGDGSQAGLYERMPGDIWVKVAD